MEQVQEVERLVYEQVLRDVALDRKTDVPIAEAKKLGALAFFGEQYGERVSVVAVPGFSMELCGGTHLRRTGEIGQFRIVSETGVAAGVRRIEALVGLAAQRQSGTDRFVLDALREKLGAGEDALVQKAAGMVEQVHQLEARVRQLAGELARNAGDELATGFEPVGEIRAVVGDLTGFDVDELRLVADRVRERLGTAFAGMLTGAGKGERLSYVVFVSEDLKLHLPAGKLAQRVGKALGGGGGGKPDIASGGGRRDRLGDGQAEFRAALSELA
jgi:alanyl-tRNA synthetase